MKRLLAACVGAAALAAGLLPASAKDITVGLAAANSGWPWYATFIKRVEAKAAENGWKALVLSANADVPTQLNQIYDLVSKKVDYIVVGPIDGSAVIPGLKAAKEAGIPVVVIGNPVDKSGDEFVAASRLPDDTDLGRGSAELAAEAVGKGGTLVIIDGFPGQPAVTIRHAAMDKVWAANDIKILGVQPANWDSTLAATVTEDLLTRYPDVKGVFSLDGAMTPGVLRSVEDAGFKGPVIGLGGTATEIQAIRDGKLYGTTCMSAGFNADAAMQAVADLAGGKTVEKLQMVASPKITKANINSCPGDW